MSAGRDDYPKTIIGNMFILENIMHHVGTSVSLGDSGDGSAGANFERTLESRPALAHPG